MTYKVVPLSKDNKEDLFRLFEENSYVHQREWKSCYCRFYHTSCTMHHWMSKSAESNKTEAIEAIDAQKMHGFLAYDQDRCIGWLNAGSILSYPRIHKSIIPEYLNDRVALTICYVVADDFIGKKVASALLDTAIETLKTKEFEMMMAIPVENPINEKSYRGFKQMYLNRGYIEEKVTSELSYFILKLR